MTSWARYTYLVLAHEEYTMGKPRLARNRQDAYGDLPMSGRVDEKMRHRQIAPDAPPPLPKETAPLRPKGRSQELYVKNINGKKLTIGNGCAGTGKTFCSVSLACEMLVAGKIKRIIATRPAVTAEEDLGFTPGTLSEKFAVYFEPVLDVLNRKLGKSYVQHAIKNQTIVAMPLGFMRGLTFDESFVLLDEAQNTTPGQMKMLLTRLGEPTKCVIEGDEAQTDIEGPNGLTDAIRRFSHLPDVGVTTFSIDDVVRSGFVKEVLLGYRD